MNNRVLILGCGDLGQGIAKELSEEGYEVVGAKRNTAQLPPYILPVSLDVCDRGSFQALPLNCDYLFYILTPDVYTEEGYQSTYVEGLRNTLEWIDNHQLKFKHVFFVSSTSVYGQQDGSWIDESSPTIPERHAGHCLLDAESLLADSEVKNGLHYSVVRFSGIYGPGRFRLIQQVVDGRGCVKEPVYWTNRIHYADCVGFLCYLLDQCENGRELETLYLASDSSPSPMWDVKNWMKSQLALDKDAMWKETDFGGKQNKRCSNQRMLASGYQLKYPTFKEGYLPVIREYIERN